MAKTTDNEKTPAQITQEQLRKENEYIIKNKRVRRQSRFRNLIIILLLFLLIISLLAGATYAIMQFVDESNFRVTVTHTGEAKLSLSHDYGFTNGGTTTLDVAAPMNMDAESLALGLDSQLIDIYNAEGSYEMPNVVATNFYLKNDGTKDVEYNEIIRIGNTIKGMDKAIRIMIIKSKTPPDSPEYDGENGTITVYAAAKSDIYDRTLTDDEGNPLPEEVVPSGTGEKSDNRWVINYCPLESEVLKAYYGANGFSINPEDIREDNVWMTKPFISSEYALNSELYPLEAGGIIKYTIVMWLEGQDEQCVDRILGGQVRVTVEFSTGTEE